MSSREKKAKLTKQFRKENEEFDKSPKGWFEKVNTTKNSRGQENQKIPDMNDFEMFSRNIWKKTGSSGDRKKWPEFMNIISLHVKVENEGSKEPNLTLFRLGGGHRFFPCCAETVRSRLMKLSKFQYNYIGHHLK